jgi:hypothetical protein
MIAFFEKTWYLWWLLANVVIVRWFHGLSSEVTWEASDPSNRSSDEHTIPGQLASRTGQGLKHRLQGVQRQGGF